MDPELQPAEWLRSAAASSSPFHYRQYFNGPVHGLIWADAGKSLRLLWASVLF